MPTCGISADLASTNCKNILVGGISDVWIIERQNITAFTEANSEITDCTLTGGTYAWNLEPIPDTAVTNSNKVEGGVTRYDNTFEFRFSIKTNTDLDIIRGLPGNVKYAIVYKNNDGNYACLGIGDSDTESPGLRCDVIENTRGAAFADNEGVLIRFAGSDGSGEIFWDNASIDIVGLTDAT